jgi:hypothetical protein
MDLTLLICCETCVQDVRTNVLSIFNLIDELAASAFPVAIPKLTVVAALRRTMEEPAVLSTRLRGTLNNQQLFDLELPLDFQTKPRTRAIGEMQGVLIPAAGRLRIGLYRDQAELGGWDIEIFAVGAPRVDLFTTPQGPSTPTAASSAAAPAVPAAE